MLCYNHVVIRVKTEQQINWKVLMFADITMSWANESIIMVPQNECVCVISCGT